MSSHVQAMIVMARGARQQLLCDKSVEIKGWMIE